MFRHLEITVTREMENLKGKKTFETLIAQAKQDIGKMSPLPISLVRRIKTIKMTVPTDSPTAICVEDHPDFLPLEHSN